MTTEEKLQHFLDFCMEDVRTRSAKMLDDYTAAMEKTFEEHKQDAKRRAEQRLQLEKEKMEREVNKKLSVEQINIKRSLSHAQDELKDKIFVELKDKLEHFMDTPEYLQLLERQIKNAMEFAGDNELIIYMDPVDENKLRRLAFHNSADIRISEYSFMGGTRAVIPSKKILIDNSFQTKLTEAKDNFRFESGGRANG